MLLTLKDLFVNKDDPFIPYIEKLQITDNLHFGQLKLFVGTLFFIVNFVKGKNPKIVIPGGGSGEGAINNFLLAELFPDYEFTLVDPIGFPPEHKKPHNVTLIQDYFTDDMVEFWKTQKNVYLISDIRTTPEEVIRDNNCPDLDLEKHVNENMRLQEKWHKEIRPEFSHFKFRFPFDVEGTYEYLEGKIMKQCFVGNKSTETRLIISKDAKTIKYDVKIYEEQLAYHNLITRRRKYENTFNPKTKKYFLEPELIGDYDSTFFVMTVQTLYKNPVEAKKFIEMVLKRLTAGKTLQKRRELQTRQLKSKENKIFL